MRLGAVALAFEAPPAHAPLPPGLEVHVYTGKVHGTPSQNSFRQLSFLWHTTSSCASPVEDGDGEIIKTRWGTLKSAQVQHMIACRNVVGMNKAAISVAVLDEPEGADGIGEERDADGGGQAMTGLARAACSSGRM